MRYIIFAGNSPANPQLFCLLNIQIFKDTALVSTISVADLMFISNTITAESYRSLEIYTTAALIYFAIAFPASLLTSYLERRSLNSGPGKPGAGLLARMLPGLRSPKSVQA